MTSHFSPQRVGVLFGGRSAEHEVSLASAHNVAEALCQAGYEVQLIGITQEGRWLTSRDPMARLSQLIDGQGRPGEEVARPAASLVSVGEGNTSMVPFADGEEPLPSVDIVFPVLHGPFGEDGTVQGLLEMANLPYVGCGVLASAMGMDKAVSKQIFTAAGLPQVPYLVMLRRVWEMGAETFLDQVETSLDYPVFVKPANMGSSIGITKAKDRPGLIQAIELAYGYDRKVIVEQAVPGAREIEVSVLGNDDPIASVPGEIVPGNEFYDYAAKYLDDNSDLLIPAPIPDHIADSVRELAVQAFRALDGAGLARVDFLLSENGALFLNELNTMPGFTRISMFPKLWEASDISYPELVHRLVQLGYQRYQENQRSIYR